MHRAWVGDATRAARLLSMGATVDAASFVGETTLVWAARGGHVDVCKALLVAGTSPTGAVTPLKDGCREGESPLLAAAMNNHASVVDLLLSVGVATTEKAVEAGAGKIGVLTALLATGTFSAAIAAAACAATLASASIVDGEPCGALLLASVMKAHRSNLKVMIAGCAALSSWLGRSDAESLLPTVIRADLLDELPLAAAAYAAASPNLVLRLTATWGALANLATGLPVIKPISVIAALSATRAHFLPGRAGDLCVLLLKLMTPPAGQQAKSANTLTGRNCTEIAAHGGIAALSSALSSFRDYESVVAPGFDALRALVNRHPQRQTLVSDVVAAITPLLATMPLETPISFLYRAYRLLLDTCYFSSQCTLALVKAGG